MRNQRAFFIFAPITSILMWWVLFLCPNGGGKNFFKKIWFRVSKCKKNSAIEKWRQNFPHLDNWIHIQQVPSWTEHKAQPNESTPRTTCPFGLSRKARWVAIPNYSEISDCYGYGNETCQGQWYFSTELAENPAEVKFLWVRLATERLLISFYAFGGWDRIKCNDLSAKG